MFAAQHVSNKLFTTAKEHISAVFFLFNMDVDNKDAGLISWNTTMSRDTTASFVFALLSSSFELTCLAHYSIHINLAHV